MTEADPIDNPVFEKDSNLLQSVEVKSADDQALIGPVMNPVKDFAQEFAKDENALLKLKIDNWVLILVLAIGQSIGLTYDQQLERWSDWPSNVNVPYLCYAYSYYSLTYMTVLTWLWLLTITFSLVMHGLKNKNVVKGKNFLSCLALMDICFCTVFFLNIPMIFLCYAHRTITEYLWFIPRLINGTPLNELTEYEAYGSSEFWSQDAIKTMKTRQSAIITRLVLDPCVTILALYLIPLSIEYVWSIYSAIKRSNLWECDYKKINPQCSKLDAGYANFWLIGLLKVIHWIVPACLCLGPYGRFLGSQTIVFKLSTACCFGILLYRWISYVKTVRFQRKNLNDAPKKGLGSDIKLDSFICLLGITFYLIVFMFVRGTDTIDTQIVSVIGIFFFVCSLLANVSLMFKYNVHRFKPLKISINFSIKIEKENSEGKETEAEKNFALIFNRYIMFWMYCKLSFVNSYSKLLTVL